MRNIYAFGIYLKLLVCGIINYFIMTSELSKVMLMMKKVMHANVYIRAVIWQYYLENISIRV